MPHIVVKLHSGRSEQQKSELAEALSRAVVSVLQCSADSVSVGIEDVTPADWPEQVYKPEITGKPGQLYKKPGYDPFA